MDNFQNSSDNINEIRNIIKNNKFEYLQLKENIELVNEIIIDLEERHKKILDYITYLKNIKINANNLFTDISKKNIKI